MAAGVITVTGPSGSGKTSFCRCLIDASKTTFCPESVPKFTTRAKRTDEADKPLDGYLEKIFVERIPGDCDIVYESYGDRYGLRMERLFELLSDGRSPVIVLNDVRAVEDVRQTFGPLVRSVFIFRESTDFHRFRELAVRRGSIEKNEAWVRYQKAYSIYRIFIENIHLFDHVVLNVGGKRELRRQANWVARGIGACVKLWPLHGVD